MNIRRRRSKFNFRARQGQAVEPGAATSPGRPDRPRPASGARRCVRLRCRRAPPRCPSPWFDVPRRPDTPRRSRTLPPAAVVAGSALVSLSQSSKYPHTPISKRRTAAAEVTARLAGSGAHPEPCRRTSRLDCTPSSIINVTCRSMCTSALANLGRVSFDAGAAAQLATNANSTRSTDVSRGRPRPHLHNPTGPCRCSEKGSDFLP
jgi:hypothetical protein